MAERLEYIRISPELVLDAGCGRGADWPLLARRFDKARILAVDRELDALCKARLRGPRAESGIAQLIPGPRLPVTRMCADFARLPIKSGALDLVWSNLALHWHDAAEAVLPEWSRCLAVGGLVMFSSFGPDTLREVRSAFAAIDLAPHTPAFTDMHDYGDMLVASGFSTPVMDMEQITLTYEGAHSLWRDVRALGGNPLVDRRRGLIGRVAGERLAAALDATRLTDGRYRLSFEVLYGHAWRAEARSTADGQAIVRFAPRERA